MPLSCTPFNDEVLVLVELFHRALVDSVGHGQHDNGLWLQRAERGLQLLQHPPSRARLDQRPVLPVELVHNVPAARVPAILELTGEVRGKYFSLGFESPGQPANSFDMLNIARKFRVESNLFKASVAYGMQTDPIRL